MNREAFLTYVEQVLAPTLRPGDLVVMDNLPAHRCAGVRTAIDELWDAIAELLPNFTPQECANYFTAAGYEPE